MEPMTKYQYTYFIYPYLIEEKRYKKYLQGLLKNKKCKIRFFDRQKDIHLYTYFLPKIKEYMFWSFDLNKSAIRDFYKLDSTVQTTLLTEHECNIFNYQLPETLQGKVEANNGIFFEISEIKIVCFKTGICFLMFKTNIENSEKFSDVLNFNYKFREINSISYDLKEYENIKIQSNSFKDVKNISKVIKEITGTNNIEKKANIGNDKFFVYSYACLDQKDWNEDTKEEELGRLFEKYRSVSPANSQILNDEYTIKNDWNIDKMKSMYKNQYLRYGFSATNTVLFTSNINTTNFTLVPQKYESEYLYTYLMVLYKKILLNKLSYEFKERFKHAEAGFLEFTKNLWIQDITNEEFGRKMEKCWMENLEVEKTFIKLKNEYDVTYKMHNVEEMNKNNKITRVVVAVILIINIITIIYSSLR